MEEIYIVIRENILNIANSNKEFLSLTKSIKGATGIKVKNINKVLKWLISLKIVNIKSQYFFITSKNTNKKFIILNKEKLSEYNSEEYLVEKCNIEEALNKLDDLKINTDNIEKEIEELEKIEEDVVYFDSGTGRGFTEVKVTNYLSQSLLDKFSKRNYMITENDTICLGNIDNTHGELYGFYLALKIAIENNIKKIAGDNQGILFKWSDGYYKNNLPKEIIYFIEKIITLKKEFKKNGGEVYYIKGGLNPADLGFHR